jgi:MinD superfamily P-loop ATPase
VIITIASGKGGTGKTTLAVNLAEYLQNNLQTGKKVKLLDCDVEAPNVHLFEKSKSFLTREVTEKKPVWNEDKCLACCKCKDICRYNAIAKVNKKIIIFKDLCHSCGACKYICPNGAISEEEYAIGKLNTVENASNYNLVYGELNIGETAAPSMVKAVKKNISGKDINIVDAPPGTGCSVVETIENSDAVVLVTEPTPFGLHDLKLAVELTEKIKIPYGIVINRSDGNDEIITDFLNEFSIPLLGRIPFKREYAEAYSKGKILVDCFPKVKLQIIKIYNNILKLIGTELQTRNIPILEELNISDDLSETLVKKDSSENGIIPKEIMIVSGKGGTGKTTVSAAFSVLSQQTSENRNIFTDCDVDAADLHLLLNPKVLEIKDFSGGHLAKINQENCIGCGKCLDHCHFDAINAADDLKFEVNDLKCEGCGLCLEVCPNNAIAEKRAINGQYYVSMTEFGPMVHARLGIAEENSGKLVFTVRSKAAELAENTGRGLIIGDGPPGTGCPVIASLTGVNLAIIVTEPTISGKHDLKRVLKLTKYFKIKSAIIINKSDLNCQMTEDIKELALQVGSEIIAEIPFDRNVNDALIEGKTIIEYRKGKAYIEVKNAWEKIQKYISD